MHLLPFPQQWIEKMGIYQRQMLPGCRGSWKNGTSHEDTINKSDYLDSEEDFVSLVAKQDCCLSLTSVLCELQSAGAALFWKAEQESGLNSVHKAAQL